MSNVIEFANRSERAGDAAGKPKSRKKGRPLTEAQAEADAIAALEGISARLSDAADFKVLLATIGAELRRRRARRS